MSEQGSEIVIGADPQSTTRATEGFAAEAPRDSSLSKAAETLTAGSDTNEAINSGIAAGLEASVEKINK